MVEQQIAGGPVMLTPQQVAKRWQVSADYVRRLFAKEPGVLVIGNGDRVHIRIPPDVLERVERRQQVA
ncbi:MAG: hypothetical protein MUF01_11240 [Bryobacterales bacterium]|jgi:hypothetical protein|nr:hypothetical protein [Bryobacterales bacterium]